MPAGAGPHAVVALIHGGFWRQRYDLTLEHAVARDLQDRGWAVWNIEYRRLEGGGGYPETFEDVAAAIDLLDEVEAPLDMVRLVALGHSAGGHLAMWAASRWSLPEGAPGAGPRVHVRAAVSQAGVLDLAGGASLSKGAARELLRGDLGRTPLTSPAERLPIGVPMLLVHGALDGDVPPEMSSAFCKAARSAGDLCDLVELPGEGHYEHLDPTSGSWKAVLRWLSTL